MQTHHDLITLTEKIPCQVHHSSDRARGNLHRSSHTQESQAKSFIPTQGEGVFGEHQQVQELLEIRCNQAARGEQEALSRLSEAEYHAGVLFEEQRSHILSEARFEILLLETRAKHAVSSIQKLNRHRFSHDAEICRRGQEKLVA